MSRVMLLLASAAMLWTAPATAGYLMIDGKKVTVPFHVVHGLFNFDAAYRAAARHAAELAKAPKAKDPEYKELMGLAPRWYGTVNATYPYVRKRKGHPTRAVRAIMLHSTVTYRVDEVIRALVNRHLSTHLLVDWDGTVYQLADLGLRAAHAGEMNEHTIGLDLVTPLHKKGSARKYDEERDQLMRSHGLERPYKKARIQAVTLEAQGYTKPQLRALYALTRALVRFFPNVPASIPRNKKGKPIMHAVEKPEGLSGVIAHWHASHNRWDPGPGIDWNALERAIRKKR